MRLLFRSAAAFNVATALWLSVMFLVLRHPNFLPKAAVTLGIAVFCVLAFRAAGAAASSGMRAAALAGSLVLGACGAWAIYQDLQPNADFEGFVLIIGAAWIVQAAAAVLYASATAAPAAGPSV
jgi:hypothetical protein